MPLNRLRAYIYNELTHISRIIEKFCIDWAGILILQQKDLTSSYSMKVSHQLVGVPVFFSKPSLLLVFKLRLIGRVI